MSVETLLHTISEHAQSHLRPLVGEIDCKGLYPSSICMNWVRSAVLLQSVAANLAVQIWDWPRKSAF